MGQVLARVRTLLPGVRVCPGRAGVRGHVVVNDLGPPVVGPRLPAYAWPSRVLADVRVDLAMPVKNAKGVAWCPEARGRGSHAQAVRQQVNRLRGRPNSWRPGPDPCSGEFVWIGGFPVWCRGTTGAHYLDEYAHAALRAGASGFLLKDALPGELLAGIRAVACGNAVIAPPSGPSFPGHLRPQTAGACRRPDNRRRPRGAHYRAGARDPGSHRPRLDGEGPSRTEDRRQGPDPGRDPCLRPGTDPDQHPRLPLGPAASGSRAATRKAPTRRGRLIQAWRPTSPLLAVRGNGSRRRGGRAAAVRPRTATQPSAPPFRDHRRS